MSDISKTDCILVVFIGLAIVVISEGLAWLAVYRREDFRKLTGEIDRLQSKLEFQKQQNKKTVKIQKRHEAQEDHLQRKTQDLGFMQLKGQLWRTVLWIGVIPIVRSLFDGIRVASLPFTPFSLIRNVSHESLGGNDPTDCSMFFLYVLSVTFFRPVVQRLMGVASPGQSTHSMLMTPKMKREWDLQQ